MAETRTSPMRARTLEYRQAMKDFHIMFPTLEKETIECVLRSNAGHVDSTIDQLLQLTQEMTQGNKNLPGLNERFHFHGNESSSSNESYPPPEFLGPPTSSDEDQPPRYTPEHDPYSFSSHPVQPARRFRDWNPPLLGTLPDDFLRIVSFRHPSTPSRISPRHTQRHERPVRSSLSPSRPHQSSSRSSLALPSGKPQSSHAKLQRRKTTGHEIPSRLSHSHHHYQQNSAPATRSRPRNTDEQSQYIEDRKVALMLQNEEFLKELKRNEHFLQELSGGDAPLNNTREEVLRPREFLPISVNPLQELPPEKPEQQATNGEENPAEENKDFKESLKNMNKSSKKSFMELARKFNARRKSYKSMTNTVDPVFADCKDE